MENSITPMPHFFATMKMTELMNQYKNQSKHQDCHNELI